MSEPKHIKETLYPALVNLIKPTLDNKNKKPKKEGVKSE